MWSNTGNTKQFLSLTNLFLLCKLCLRRVERDGNVGRVWLRRKFSDQIVFINFGVRKEKGLYEKLMNVSEAREGSHDNSTWRSIGSVYPNSILKACV